MCFMPSSPCSGLSGCMLMHWMAGLSSLSRLVTPMNVPLHLRAHVVESGDDRAVVEASIEANGKVTATCRGTFVAVKEGHPAYHRW